MGVHVEIDDDPVAIAERIAVRVRRVRRRTPPAGGVGVHVLEPLRELGEVALQRARTGLLARARAERLVLDEPRHGRGRELRLLGEAGRIGDRTAARACLEQQPGAAARGGHEDGRLGQRRPPRLRLHERPRPRPVAHRRRDRRAARQRCRAREHDLPAGQGRQQAQHRPGDRALTGRQLDDDQLPLPRRREDLGVDPERDRLIVAGIPLRGPLDGRLRRAEERVDPREELCPLVLARGDRDALGREECRGSRCLRLEQRRRREAREPRLESVDDVECAERERGGEVGANAHRQRDPLAERGRDGGADRDDVTDHAALQGAPSLEEVGGA